MRIIYSNSCVWNCIYPTKKQTKREKKEKSRPTTTIHLSNAIRASIVSLRQTRAAWVKLVKQKEIYTYYAIIFMAQLFTILFASNRKVTRKVRQRHTLMGKNEKWASMAERKMKKKKEATVAVAATASAARKEYKNDTLTKTRDEKPCHTVI